jgi:hypothetical protein
MFQLRCVVSMVEVRMLEHVAVVRFLFELVFPIAARQ